MVPNMAGVAHYHLVGNYFCVFNLFSALGCHWSTLYMLGILQIVTTRFKNAAKPRSATMLKLSLM